MNKDRPFDPDLEDRLTIFSQLPAVQVSDQDVEEMQHQVLAMARLSELTSNDDDDQLFGTTATRLGVVASRGRMFAAAAALVLSVGAIALLLQTGLIGEDSQRAEPTAGELAQARLESELVDLLEVLPLVEELDTAPNRFTYQLDDVDLDVVMVVDEALDL